MNVEVFVLLGAGVFLRCLGVLSHLVTMRVTLKNKTSGDDGVDAGGEGGKGLTPAMLTPPEFWLRSNNWLCEMTRDLCCVRRSWWGHLS